MASGRSQLPSRFIDELPADHVEVLTAAGPLWRRLWGGGAWRASDRALEERVSKADVYNSPGWRRMQERSAARGRCGQPREARDMVIDVDGGVALRAGRPGVPPEVRLRRDHGDRGRQAGHRVRQGGREEGRRALRACPRRKRTTCRSD